MKTILYTLSIVLALALTQNQVQAQAYEKGTTILGLGIGASQFLHMDRNYYGVPRNRNYWYGPQTAQINLQFEFGVSKYVGVGLTTGIGGRRTTPNGNGSEFNIPIGLIVNFHFYQLIADNAEKSIHADKLDLYFGLSIGSGISSTRYNDSNSRSSVPIAFAGIHGGIRYFFLPKVGFNAEMGWGKSIVNLGFVFKI